MAAKEMTRRLLRGAALTGAVATAFGALTLSGYASQIGGWKPPISPTVIASVTSWALLVATQVLLCAAWAVFAAAGSSARHPHPFAVVAVVGKLTSTVGVMIANWDGAWEYILDLQGNHNSIFLMIIASGVMDVLLILAALKVVKTPDIDPEQTISAQGAGTSSPGSSHDKDESVSSKEV